MVLGQVLAGTLLAGAAGFGVGLAAEAVCDACDAAEPGGDTPGLVLGVPAAAALGVWLAGKWSPLPRGRLPETALGALVGTAVFAGFSELLNDQDRGVRWIGIVFPAAVATLSWQRSRSVEWNRLRVRADRGGWTAEAAVVRLRF